VNQRSILRQALLGAGLALASAVAVSSSTQKEQTQEGKKMDASPIQVTIKPIVKGKTLSVEMVAKNISAQDAYLEKFFFDTQLKSPVFKIEGAQGKAEVEYVGMMVKRVAPTIADYTKLAPGQAVTHTVAIDAVYEFPAQPASYQMTYGLTDMNPTNNKITERRSNTVSFTYPGN
jgi:hypothetical protein